MAIPTKCRGCRFALSLDPLRPCGRCILQHYRLYEPLDPTEQDAKADAGKLRLTLVPPEIIRAIAAVRMYGTEKYGDLENWRNVSPERYRDALCRHLLAYLEDPQGLDEESGLPHLFHVACNVSFLCEMDYGKTPH